LLRCDELFVIEQDVSTEIVWNVPFAIIHQHQMLEVGKRVEQRGEQRDDRAINKDHLVIGVVYDIGQLLREQPDVQRVQHSAGTWSGEIQLEVTRRIPGKRGDTPVSRNSQGVKRSRQLARPPSKIGVRRALNAIRSSGDDLLVPVVPLGSIKEMVNR
jgi:hypothetical protein